MNPGFTTFKFRCAIQNRPPLLPRLAFHYARSLRNLRLSKSELVELQLRKARRLVHFAQHNIPYYAEQFKQAGMKDGDIRTLDDFRKIPTLTRDGAISNYSKITFAGEKAALIRHTTGTSTGKSFAVPFSHDYCDVVTALRMRRNNILGIGFLDRDAEIEYSGPVCDSSSQQSDRSIAAGLYKFLFKSVLPRDVTLQFKTFGVNSESLPEVAREIHKFRPSVIHGKPSYLLALAEVLHDADLDFQTKKVICGSEFLSKGLRKELANLYGAPVFDHYGAKELGTLGFECKEHAGLHMNSDYYIFECLHDGEPASPGERAELVITCLHNFAMPLIRYKIGDIVVPSDAETCACGSKLQRLDRNLGKSKNAFVSKSWIKIPPGVIADFVETELGLRNYELIQKEPWNFELHLCGEQVSDQKIRDLAAFLQDRLELEPHLSVKYEPGSSLPLKRNPIVSKADEISIANRIAEKTFLYRSQVA